MKNVIVFGLLVVILLGLFGGQMIHFNSSTGQAASIAEVQTAVPTAMTAAVQPTIRPTTQPTAKPTKKAAANPLPAARSTTVPGLPEGPSAAAQPAAVSSPTPTATAIQTQNPVSDLPVTLETLAIFAKSLDGAERVAEVYLPGGYAQNPDQRYPVLYALDGQQLPQIDFAQTLNKMVETRAMAQVIVVAVHSTEGDLRREELGAGPELNLFGWGTLSNAFNEFLVNELVPAVNSKYRTLTGATNTAVMGWSLGGLTSFYLGWEYSATFGIVGAFSPSFWWRTASPAGEELQARVIPNLVAASDRRPGLRMWFEAGTKELPYSDVDNNGVIDMIQDVQDVMRLLAQKGYQENTDMVYVEVPGGLHELSTWETVLPDFLHFAFPA